MIIVIPSLFFSDFEYLCYFYIYALMHIDIKSFGFITVEIYQ